MTLQTYQSQLVLRTLKSGKTYRAKPNLKLQGEYGALIDLLGLHCECPGVRRGKGQAAEHRGPGCPDRCASPWRCPDDQVHLTEYGVWADFFVRLQIYQAGELPLPAGRL